MLFLLSFLILLATWVVFSGLLDGFHLTLGVLSCLFVSLISTRVLFPQAEVPSLRAIGRIGWFIHYLGWLIKEVVLANFHVFGLAMAPGGTKRLHPELVSMPVRLKGEAARYLLANSITLTPGTVSVKIEGDHLTVHSISRKTTEGLESDMELRIARIFGEDIAPPTTEG